MPAVFIIHIAIQWVGEGDRLIDRSAPAPSRHPSRDSLSLTPSVFLSPPSSHLLAHAVQHRLIAIRGIASVTETIGAPLSLCLYSIL